MNASAPSPLVLRQRSQSPFALGKYLAIARSSFRRRLEERSVLVGRVAFYGVILMVFSKLWQVVFAAQERSGSPAPSAAFGGYVWYLVVTEWIMLSQPSVHMDVQADIQSGDIAHQLSRPMSYVGSKLAEGLGDLALRLLVLGAAGLSFGRLFAESWPNPAELIQAALVGLLSSLLMLLCLLSIGLCAFWMHDCMPVYMVWQKLVFVLGGLMLPLSIYPDWLRSIALASPFAAMLFGPGDLVIGGNAIAASLARELVAWCVVAVSVALLLERRALRRLVVEGG
jgi:ABC-2 type transport system permease protein